MKGCNNCVHKTEILMRESGCFLMGCAKKGKVPFWTNKEKLLDNVECSSWSGNARDKIFKQLELF